MAMSFLGREICRPKPKCEICLMRPVCTFYQTQVSWTNVDMPTRLQKTFLIILAVCGWFALIAQFYLIMVNRVASIPETIIRYFSFFTILTNLIVAVCCTVILLKPSSSTGKFFSRPTILTAIVVYITVVGIVYNTVLRFLWNPQGLQLIVDELLHSVIPLLFIILWFPVE